jgi:site-specific DNA recombinase
MAVSTFADEMERERARQRTGDVMRRKALAGHVTGGTVYGYENVDVLADVPAADGRPRRQHVVRRINPEEARILREIFERYVAGAGLRTMAVALNDRGVAPPRGGAHSWAHTAIREMLGRELYRGVIVWNRT